MIYPEEEGAAVSFYETYEDAAMMGDKSLVVEVDLSKLGTYGGIAIDRGTISNLDSDFVSIILGSE